MEIKEVIKLRISTEEAIGDLINTFAETTGLKINNIFLETIDVQPMGGLPSYIYRTHLVVEV